MQALEELGLNRGTSGNASVRQKNNFLVTPSGIAVKDMTTSQMVEMDMQGAVIRTGKPSSEWRFHRDIYLARPEVNAVIHTHSMFATTLACLQKEIPPFHYMIAIAGGSNIRCSKYQLFGTQALSNAAILALKDRRACLLAKHGMIAIGRDLAQAMDIAFEVEGLCEQYWRALQIGTPENLTLDEMDEVFEQFKGYGNWDQ
jgi:L-fuculose-phosphate aldolase